MKYQFKEKVITPTDILDKETKNEAVIAVLKNEIKHINNSINYIYKNIDSINDNISLISKDTQYIKEDLSRKIIEHNEKISYIDRELTNHIKLSKEKEDKDMNNLFFNTKISLAKITIIIAIIGLISSNIWTFVSTIIKK